MDRRPHGGWLAAAFLLPTIHPLFIPLVGPPSHLLWWVHILPVALLTFHRGRGAALRAMAVSAALVAGGEALFGAGYGTPATLETIVLLTAAVTGTNLLVVWFALHARSIGHRYRILFENVHMGIIQVDRDGHIRALNPEAGTLLDRTAGSLVGRPLGEVISLPGCRSIRELEGGGAWTGTIELAADGAPRSLPVFLVVVPDTETGGCQLLVKDRSLEVAQGKELERQSKLAALGEALAGVAHELNNPLTTILAHAQLGAAEDPEGEDAEDPGETFAIIAHEAERMRDLIQELLGFSRRDSAERTTAVGPLVSRLVRVQRMALPRAVTLDEEIAWDGEVRATATKLEQILLNLVSNAAYEVERSGGGRVVVATRRSENSVEIEVRDDGPGVPEELLPTIFEPFVTTKPEGEGTGLGLPIARRLARSWGGDLRARNLEDGGAAFTMALPLTGATEAADDRAGADPSEESEGEVASGAGPRPGPSAEPAGAGRPSCR